MFSELLNYNICNAKIYWTKSNFPLKCNSKSDEDVNKHSLASCEGNSTTLYLLRVSEADEEVPISSHITALKPLKNSENHFRTN